MQLPVNPPTDDPKSLLGWIVAGLLFGLGVLWRLYERKRDKVETDLKVENTTLETKLSTLADKYETKIASLVESNDAKIRDLEARLEAANEKYVREIKANAVALNTARETTRRVLRDSGYPSAPDPDDYEDTTGVTRELNVIRRQAIEREAELARGRPPADVEVLPPPKPPAHGAPVGPRRRPAVEENNPRGRPRTDR